MQGIPMHIVAGQQGSIGQRFLWVAFGSVQSICGTSYGNIVRLSSSKQQFYERKLSDEIKVSVQFSNNVVLVGTLFF